MNISLNLQDDSTENQTSKLKAKLPISIFNQPFTSIFTTTTTNAFSDLSFSLSTNFPSGPSLKLTYSPSSPLATTTTTTTAAPVLPFSFSLKSGLGLFGSPHNSPLVFSANFAVSPSSSYPILPSFSLQFKPRFGHFSFRKRTYSSVLDEHVDANCGCDSTIGTQMESGSPSKSEPGNGFSSDGSSGWQELKLEASNGKEKLVFGSTDCFDSEKVCFGSGVLSGRELVWRESRKDGFFSGVGVMARTVVPLSNRFRFNFRWGVNWPNDVSKLPYLTLSKIGIERVEEVKKFNEEVKRDDNNQGDVELLKGTSFWMRRDLEVLEKENRHMKQILEELRSGASARNLLAEGNGGQPKAVPPVSDSYARFEEWRKKKNNGEENTKKETRKPVNQGSDLESELQKAIKAASS